MADLAMPAGTPAIPPERACRLHGDQCSHDPAETHQYAPAATPADQGLAARQLAEHTRRHMDAAASARQAANGAHRDTVVELARRALADADRIQWQAPNAHLAVAEHLGTLKRTMRALLNLLDEDGGQQ